MKTLAYFLLLSVLFSNCKKNDLTPPAEIEEIVGAWRLEAVEKVVDGQAVWEKVNDDPPYRFIFRHDGVPLDINGLGQCCSPDSLIVNGTPVKIRPTAKIPKNPDCALINCFTCPTWGLEQNGDELVITQDCQSQSRRFRYVRE